MIQKYRKWFLNENVFLFLGLVSAIVDVQFKCVTFGLVLTFKRIRGSFALQRVKFKETKYEKCGIK